MTTNENLIAWINNQPAWVRKATALYYQQDEITEQDISDLADLCMAGTDDFKVSDLNLISRGSCQSFSIRSIQNIKGVNAITSDQPLTFGPKGITVVYGLNGAGKSGYIRILKMAAGARCREEIKRNIYSDKKIAPSAEIEVECCDGSLQSYVCDLREAGSAELLRNIDIFDTKLSTVYMTESKEASFEPWIFSLLTTLATSVSERIKAHLRERKKEFTTTEILFPEELHDTPAYTQFQSISRKSCVDDFPSEWTEAQENELVELRAKNQRELLETKLGAIKKELLVLEQIANYFEGFSKFFSKTSMSLLTSSQKEWIQANADLEAAKILFSESAERIDAQNVANQAWKNLWRYAEQYYTAALKNDIGREFATVDSICPLCHQEIESQDIANRMQGISRYVNGKIASGVQATRKTFEEYLRGFPAVKSDKELCSLIESSGMNNSKTALVEMNALLQKFSKVIANGATTEQIPELDFTEIEKSIKGIKASLQATAEDIQKTLDDEKQVELIKKIREMEALKHLTGCFKLIKSNILNLIKLGEIDDAIKAITTNKITTKSKVLSEELITEDYIRRFSSELKGVAGTSIEVKLKQQKAGKGKTPYRVVLIDNEGNEISPQDVLSEGENRATSLAAFFAEASGRPELAPLIVDDPISSLDYEFENKVIRRLVHAATERQVIVFTHRISMVVGVSEYAKKIGVEYTERSLLASKERKGVPTEVSLIGGKLPAQLNNLINQNLQQLKKMDALSPEFESNYNYLCQQFRIVVEKSIEEVLLGRIVVRFRREIQTQNIKSRLSSITPEDCEIIDEMMTKYSYYDHPSADETPMIEMSIEELEQDMSNFALWMKSKK